MEQSDELGQIVVLNGAPRSGKSSIAIVIQQTFDGVWMNLGVDAFLRSVVPLRYQPGIGLRPGEKDHAVAPLVPAMYAALFDSIAAHSRNGLNVVVDVGMHESNTPGILADCAGRLDGLPALFVGVRCPIEVIMERRNAGDSSRYVTGTAAGPVPAPVRLWQEAVHIPGVYDLEVDTSVLSAEECAARIRTRLDDGREATALRELAGQR